MGFLVSLSINIAQKPYIIGSLGPKALKYESFDAKGMGSRDVGLGLLCRLWLVSYTSMQPWCSAGTRNLPILELGEHSAAWTCPKSRTFSGG